jgi:hypothetical protein
MQDTLREVRMKHRVVVGLVAGALLLSASGSALAAGKMGGAGSGVERSSRPAFAGKMGGSASGLGAWQIACQEETQDGERAGEMDSVERFGGKIGVAGGED